jgi:hypothetical protein
MLFAEFMNYRNTYKQALTLLFAISFGGLWAMDGQPVVDPAEAHRATAHTELCSAYAYNDLDAEFTALQTTLAGHPDFNFLTDARLVRSLETGYYMRMAMLGLEENNLSTLVTDHPDFFKTSVGASLLYMWMAKQSGLFYIAEFHGPNYRFANVHDRMADGASDDATLQQLLKNTCRDAVANVQAEPLTFLGQILYFPHELGVLSERTLAAADALEKLRARDSFKGGGARESYFAMFTRFLTENSRVIVPVVLTVIGLVCYKLYTLQMPNTQYDALKSYRYPNQSCGDVNPFSLIGFKPLV